VNGRQLYAQVAGEGGPTIVLEAGAECPSSLWDPIWPSLQQSTTVFRYDRANLGKSGPAEAPRSPHEAVADLHTLLRKVGARGPYLLVGHSFGGLLVRLFAQHFPHEVAGIVLLDSAHHEQNERYLPLLPPPFPEEPGDLTRLRRLCSDPKTVNAEGFQLGNVQIEVGKVGGLGALPLLVVSRAPGTTPSVAERRRPGYPPAAALALETLWDELQRDLTTLSTRCTHVVATHGNHFLHHDEPTFVASQILQFSAALRNEREATH
jgi:pimeloyl-ACP methyl ester carboxylesterase